MIALPAGRKVWIAGGVTDMRNGMNKLALQVQQGPGRNPHAGADRGYAPGSLSDSRGAAHGYGLRLAWVAKKPVDCKTCPIGACGPRIMLLNGASMGD